MNKFEFGKIAIKALQNPEAGKRVTYYCRRAFKSDQLCALNFDQGR